MDENRQKKHVIIIILPSESQFDFLILNLTSKLSFYQPIRISLTERQ